MDYKFKFWPELYLAVCTGAALAALTILVEFHPEDITDWRRWAIVLGGSMARSAAAAATVVVTKLVRSML